MSKRAEFFRQGGATLVELIIAMTAIAIAVGGVLLAFVTVVGHSADPMVQQQALAVAEAYLDEILARPAAEPTGGETGGAEPGETRAFYDDVQDYHGLTEAPRSQDGSPIAGLGAYRVRIQVRSVSLGPAADTVPAHEIEAVVTGPAGLEVVLRGYRTAY